MMEDILPDDFLPVGVPQYDVGIESDRDRALPRIKAVHFGMVGRGQRHELVGRNAARDDALAPQNRKARLDAGDAVRQGRG